jgi:phospholipase/carboxylesterase
MESLPLEFKVAPFNTNQPGLHPALIFLHGRGTDENDLLDLTSSFDSHVLIASVRAPFSFPYGGYTWFDLDENGAMNIDQLLHSRDTFLRWLDGFQQKFPVNLKQIFLFGFSMGAMMSLTVSLSSPKRFKGAVVHSGFLPVHEQLTYQWDELGDLSIYLAHGEYDPIVPVQLGRQAHQRLLQSKAHVQYHEYPFQHTISEESLGDIAAWLHQQL